MKTKQKITLVAAFAALFAFSTYSWAQLSDEKINEKIEHRIEKMKKKLNLSDAQVAQVKTIIEQAKPQIIADRLKMRATAKDQKPALREQMQKDMEATKDKLLAVLNPDQRVKAEKFFEHDKEMWEHENEKK